MKFAVVLSAVILAILKGDDPDWMEQSDQGPNFVSAT